MSYYHSSKMDSIHENHYACVSDLIRACDLAREEGRKHYEIGGEDDHSSFWGRKFDSWDEIKQAIQSPWKEGLDVVQEMIFEIERESHTVPEPMMRKRRMIWDENQGDEIDKDRLDSGQAYWRRSVRAQSIGPQFVTIVTGISALGSVSADRILWRGAVGIVLADLLEKAGYRVKLIVASHSQSVWRGTDQISLITTVIKEESDPVDISQLVNVSSGWFFRTVIFQARMARRGYTVNSTYGSTVRIYEGAPWIKELAGNNSTPILIDNVWNREAAMEKIREVITKINKGGEDDD